MLIRKLPFRSMDIEAQPQKNTQKIHLDHPTHQQKFFKDYTDTYICVSMHIYIDIDIDTVCK